MTTILPIPVSRYLVPDGATPLLPDDAIRIQQALVRGLPATLQLDAELSLVLYVPTGDAVLWRDAQPSDALSSAADETAPRDPADIEDPVARAPARLVLCRGANNIAAIALRPGLSCQLPDDGVSPAVVELWVLDFELYAGTIGDAGDFGSFIDLAWRRIDAGTDTYARPPLDPRVADMFAGEIQSGLGGGS